MTVDNDKSKASSAGRHVRSRVGRSLMAWQQDRTVREQRGSVTSPAVSATSLLAFAAVGGVIIAMYAQFWSNTSLPLILSMFFCGSAATALGAGWVLRSARAKSAEGRRRAVPGADDIAAAPVQLAEVLNALVALSEARDAQTGGHCQRLVDYSLAIGAAYGLGASELDDLYWAALLHDIGKVTVPETILRKAGRLTEDELAEIRRHPAYGSDLISSISPRLANVAWIVRAHHERWDGRGYPSGVAGEAIPIAARILAIADVFEALTTERPYRKPLSAAQAAIYIRRGAGTQFDPKFVSLFEGVFAENRLSVMEVCNSSRFSVGGDAVPVRRASAAGCVTISGPGT